MENLDGQCSVKVGLRGLEGGKGPVEGMEDPVQAGGVVRQLADPPGVQPLLWRRGEEVREANRGAPNKGGIREGVNSVPNHGFLSKPPSAIGINLQASKGARLLVQ